MPLSLGTINQVQGKLTDWLWPVVRPIRDYLRQRAWVHADETRHQRNSESRWMWVMATPEAAYFQTHYSRGKGAAQNLLGELFDRVLVSDRHGGYNGVDSTRRQFCLAHIIRNFEAMRRRQGYDGKLGGQIQRVLRALIRLEHRRAQYRVTVFRQRVHRLREILQSRLQHGQLAGRARTRNQCKQLLSQIESVFTFVGYPGLPLTNNEAERAIRPYVIWRKTSFFSQSMRGDQFRAYILSVTETCKRQGIDSLKVLEQVCRDGLSGKLTTASALADYPALE